MRLLVHVLKRFCVWHWIAIMLVMYYWQALLRIKQKCSCGENGKGGPTTADHGTKDGMTSHTMQATQPQGGAPSQPQVESRAAAAAQDAWASHDARHCSKAWSRPNWWSSKGRQGGNQQTKSDIKDTDVTHNTPFEPHMVYRMILPVSSANMGTTWWKERIEQAGKFGVKMTWRVVRRNPDFDDISPLYVAPSA